MAVIELTESNFEPTVTNNKFVIIDFWAPWCGPCRTFGPIFEQVAKDFDDIVFAKINTEIERGIAGYFQIRSIPTLMVFREQVIVYSQPGALPETALRELIKQCRALDMDSVRKQIAEEQQQS